VGKDQSSHPRGPGPAGHGLDGQVTADAAGKPDRTAPRRRLGEHQVRVVCPARKFPEFRRPDNDAAPRLDPVTERRVTRVHDGACANAKAAALEVAHVGDHAARPGEAADRRHQLGALVRHEPRVEAASRHRAWPAIEHHAHTRVRDQQPRRSVTGRGLRSDT
jgi:hypothetical protein